MSFKKGNTPLNKGKKSPETSGEKNSNWKGGKPHCEICGILLAKRSAKRCRSHRIISEKTRKRFSKRMKGNNYGFKKGQASWNKGTKGVVIAWNKGKHYDAVAGEKCHLWKGGISQFTRTERRNLMQGVEYKNWRRKVFERDNYTCQNCGAKNVYLEADHIKSWKDYPESRFDVNNGQTLCLKCHKNKTFAINTNPQ